MEIIKSSALLLFFFLINSFLFSQNLEGKKVEQYAQQIVADLSSENMHGRGYVKNGDKIAANYLQKEFLKLKLRPFKEEYFQEFDFPVNTFPGKLQVSMDGKELCPGKDYILGGSSASISGEYPLVHFNALTLTKKKLQKKFLANDFSGMAIVVDKAEMDLKDKQVQAWMKDFSNNTFKAKAVIFVEDKLTAEFSTSVKEYAILKLLRGASTGIEKTIKLDIENKFIEKYNSQNVIGYIKGKEQPDSFLVYSAHYDHLGHMGETVYFPGANDNASGCAMLLALAKHYSKVENQPNYSIAFMAFGAEEVGLIGSAFYTKHPHFPLSNIKFLLNMDIVGTGEEGITVVNGAVFDEEFKLLTRLNTEGDFLSEIKARGKAPISDHHFFTENGVKSFFIYTRGGIKAYHDIYDKPETLPLNKFADLYQLIVHFGNQLQN